MIPGEFEAFKQVAALMGVEVFQLPTSTEDIKKTVAFIPSNGTVILTGEVEGHIISELMYTKDEIEEILKFITTKGREYLENTNNTPLAS